MAGFADWAKQAATGMNRKKPSSANAKKKAPNNNKRAPNPKKRAAERTLIAEAKRLYKGGLHQPAKIASKLKKKFGRSLNLKQISDAVKGKRVPKAPKVGRRERPQPAFESDDKRVLDNKDHFPINTEARARNAMARAAQYENIGAEKYAAFQKRLKANPSDRMKKRAKSYAWRKWWGGSLKELQQGVVSNSLKKYPKIVPDVATWKKHGIKVPTRERGPVREHRLPASARLKGALFQETDPNVLDKADHLQAHTKTQAAKLVSATLAGYKKLGKPKWWKGSLKSLLDQSCGKIEKKYPGLIKHVQLGKQAEKVKAPKALQRIITDDERAQIIAGVAKKLRTSREKAETAIRKTCAKLKKYRKSVTEDDTLRLVAADMGVKIRTKNKGALDVPPEVEAAWMEFSGYPVTEVKNLHIPNLPKNTKKRLVGVRLKGIDYDQKRRTDGQGRPSKTQNRKHFTHDINRNDVWFVWDADNKKDFYIGFEREPKKPLVNQFGIEI